MRSPRARLRRRRTAILHRIGTLLSLALLLLQAVPAYAAPPAPASLRLGEVLRVLDAEYESRERLQPTLLLDGALQAASEAIPALQYELRERPGSRQLVLRIAGREAVSGTDRLTSLGQLEALLGEIGDFIAASLPPEERPAQLPELFTTGMLRVLDSHSALMSAAAYGDFQSRASGRLGGLGMQLARHERHLTVEAVLPDSPAARAGVRPGDRVLQIGERAALHLAPETALGLIRGRVGTQVELAILRPRETSPRLLQLRRSELSQSSVDGRQLGDGPRERVAYLRIRSFQDTTASELHDALQRLRTSGSGLLGIVLDLRDDPGGVLEQAIRVADQFIERGTLVTMRGARIRSESVQARWYRSLTTAPLVVLVNEGTASAAEIVAGALKHNHRALLIGTPTFGKDSIQSVFPLSGGNAIKLTVARFYPVGARSIDGTGIVPHVLLRRVRLGDGAPRGLLGTAVATGTAAPRMGEDSVTPLRELPYLADDADAVTDYPLEVALAVLRANGPQGQGALFNSALAWLPHERRRQDQRIAERLAALGVDWTPSLGGPGGQVELSRVFLEQRADARAPWVRLDDGGVLPGAELRLTLMLRNAGALPLNRVLAITESAGPYLNGLELPVGLLPEGGTAQASATLAVPPDVAEGDEPLRLRIYDGQRRLQYTATVFIPQAAVPETRLQVELAALDDGTGGSRGNGDGRAQVGEVVALRVRLHNQGPAQSGTGGYWLSGAAAEGRALPWRPYGSVGPGQSVEAYLTVPIGVPAADAPAPLSLNVMSDRMAAPELDWALAIHPGQPLPSARLQVPRIALRAAGAVTEGALQPVLRGQVSDERALRDVVVFRNGRKAYYAAPPDGAAKELPLRLRLPLEPGRNLLEVQARNRDGLLSTRTYLIWQGRGHGFPIAGLSLGSS